MPFTELHSLAERNEINNNNIQLLIGDINTVNEDRTTPLHVALIKNYRVPVLFLNAYEGNIHLECSSRCS